MSASLSDTLIRAPRKSGLDPIQPRGTHGSRELSTSRLRLDTAQSAEISLPDAESVVVLQSGRGKFECGGESWSVARKDVFSERATAIYLPPGAKLRVTADAPLEAVVVSAPAPSGGTPALAGPDNVTVNQRGKGGYAREVHDIFVRDSHVRRLMVGETFNPPGNWSSFPPHKHDGRDGEPKLEEVYYFRIDPPQGFGMQILYTADGESTTHQVRDGDVVVLPYGYHPVASPPGYKLYYLWAMVGEQRALALHEDPNHVWIHKT